MSTVSASPATPGTEPVPGQVFRSELNPVDFLYRAAYMYPDKAAVVDGERRYSYRQLAERSWRLANAPRGGSGQGRPGRHAAVQLPGDARGAFRRTGRGRNPGGG
jgi:hypothetical protein